MSTVTWPSHARAVCITVFPASCWAADGAQCVQCPHPGDNVSNVRPHTPQYTILAQHQWHHDHQELVIYTSPRRAKNMKTPSLCSLRAMACNVWCPPLTTLIPRALATFLADCCSSLIPLSLSAAADNLPTDFPSKYLPAVSPLPPQPRLMLTLALVALLLTEINWGFASFRLNRFAAEMGHFYEIIFKQCL